MARSNFSRIRYKVYAILECGDIVEGIFMKPLPEGHEIVCVKCGGHRKIAAVQSDVYTVGSGW